MIYSIYRLLQVNLVIVVLFSGLSFADSEVEPKVIEVSGTDTKKCYLGYAKEQLSKSHLTKSPLATYMDPCTDVLNGEAISGNKHAKVSALTREPNPNVSDAAAAVYYNNETCGSDTRIGAIFCADFGKLSRTSPNGVYKYHVNCGSVSNSQCKNLGYRIAEALGSVCDKDVAGRIYCDEFIHGALSNKLCAESAGADSCLTYVAKQKENGLCQKERFNKIDCFNVAEVTDPTPTDGEVEPIDSTAGGPTNPSDGASDGDIDPTATNALEKLAEDEAQNFFGSGGTGLNSGSGNSNPISNNTSAPDIQSESNYSASRFDGSGDYDNTSIVPTSAQTGRSLISQLPPPNGRPGIDKTRGNTPNSAGPSPRGGGGGGGSLGGGSGSTGGGKSRGRRGRRASKVTKASEMSTNRFYGATGSNESSGNPTTISPALRKKIRENRKATKLNADKFRVNAALQSGLNKGTGLNASFDKPIFNFPVEEAFSDLAREERFVNENGQLD